MLKVAHVESVQIVVNAQVNIKQPFANDEDDGTRLKGQQWLVHTKCDVQNGTHEQMRKFQT